MRPLDQIQGDLAKARKEQVDVAVRVASLESELKDLAQAAAEAVGCVLETPGRAA